METPQGVSSSDRVREMDLSTGAKATQQVGQILKGDNAIGLRQEAIDTELNWAMTVTSLGALPSAEQA